MSSVDHSSLPDRLSITCQRQLFRDYLSLMKPRVMVLVIFTAFVGMVVDTSVISPGMMALSLFAIAVGAGGSAALNMAAEGDIDAVMARTARRPVPAGRVSAMEAEQLGIMLSVLSVMLLGLAANWLAAFLLAFTILFYGLVYTRFLKKNTAQNIVIGGLAGALPPLIGAAAVTGSLTLAGFLLMTLIFVWTPPHFWALALVVRADYEAVNIPMLPSVKGIKTTLNQMRFYGWVCLFVSALPLLLSLAGIAYGLVFILGNGLFLWSLYQIKETNDPLGVDRKKALRSFQISIAYLFFLFAALLCESLMNLSPVSAWL